MAVHRAGVQPKRCHGAFSQGTEDPFSFPKAEGANAIVYLGVTSPDQDGKEKAEGRRATV